MYIHIVGKVAQSERGAWALSLALPVMLFMLNENAGGRGGGSGLKKGGDGCLSLGVQRKILQLLSCVMDAGQSDFAAEVVRQGTLSSVVALLSEHDALFREGVGVLGRMVACVAQLCQDGAPREDWEGVHFALLQSLENGLDCEKPHVRRAVVDAFLSLDPLVAHDTCTEKASNEGRPSGARNCGRGEGFWGQIVAADNVKARGLAARACCDADALVTEAGAELYQLVDMAYKNGSRRQQTEMKDGEAKDDQALVRWLMTRVQSTSSHVRTSVSLALAFCFQSTAHPAVHVGAERDVTLAGDDDALRHVQPGSADMRSSSDEWRWSWVLGTLHEWYVCMYVCVCVYAYTYAYIHSYMHTHTHAHIHISTHTCMHT
jgi:hypothetical protein